MNCKFLNKMRSSFLYGKALKCFEKKNFKTAAELFKIVLSLEPVEFRRELTLYYLGISHLALGNSEEALFYLSGAYDIFIQRDIGLYAPDDLYYFKILTSEYIKVLSQTGRDSLAERIRAERDQLLGWKNEGTGVKEPEG